MTLQNKPSNEKTQELHNDYLTEFIFNIFKKSYVDVIKNHSSIKITCDELYLKVEYILADIKERGEDSPNNFTSLWDDIFLEMRMSSLHNDEDSKFLTTYVLLFVCEVINTSSEECYYHTMEYVLLTQVCENYRDYQQIYEFLNRYFENLPKEHEAWFDNYCSQDNRYDNFVITLKPYGFFELPKVKSLSKVKQKKLIMAILDRPIPFKVAMLKVLGYLDNLVKVTANKTQMLFILEKALGLKPNDRSLKGNVNILKKGSKEDSGRYTSDGCIPIAEDLLDAL